MPYYQKVLQPGEEIRFVGRPHWIVYARSLWAMVLSAIAYAMHAYTAQDVYLYFAGVAALLWLVIFISIWLRRVSTEIVVTDKRVIYKTGLLSRHTMEMNVQKIETVDVLQSIIGRILDYGAIIIRGTGSTYEPISHVPSPLKLRNAIIVQ